MRHRDNIKMDGGYMDKLPGRKNIRLKNYDYSQAGYYFITICSKDKKSLFWEVDQLVKVNTII